MPKSKSPSEKKKRISSGSRSRVSNGSRSRGTRGSRSRGSNGSRTRGTRGSRSRGSNGSRSRGSNVSRSRGTRGSRSSRGSKRSRKRSSSKIANVGSQKFKKKVAEIKKTVIEVKKVGVNKTINKNIQKFMTKMGKKKMVAKPMCYYGNWDKKNPHKMSGKRMSVEGFFNQLRKDFKDEKVKKKFISDCKRFIRGGKSGGGQSGGAWFTAGFFSKFVNITMGVTAIIILINGSAAQDTIVVGFTALIKGNCNSLAEMTYSYMGAGNLVCNTWRSVWSTILTSLAGDPTSIAKLTGTIVLIMKSPRWIPALHGQFILKLGNVCVLGGIMSVEEFEQLTMMYSGSQVTEWGIGNVLGTGPTFEQLED